MGFLRSFIFFNSVGKVSVPLSSELQVKFWNKNCVTVYDPLLKT